MFAMFSDEGNQAVARALEGRLDAVRHFRSLGFVPTEDWIAKMVHGTQEEVAKLGFPEARDTAVREAIGAALEGVAA